MQFIIISFSREASIKGASYQVLVGVNVILDQIYNNRSGTSDENLYTSSLESFFDETRFLLSAIIPTYISSVNKTIISLGIPFTTGYHWLGNFHTTLFTVRVY